MILKFATKRNQNGNRKYIAIDTNKSEYARQPQSWFCREDIIEIPLKDLRKLLQACKDNNFLEVEYM